MNEFITFRDLIFIMSVYFFVRIVAGIFIK